MCLKFSTIKKLKQSLYCRWFFKAGTCPSKRDFPGGSKVKNPPANTGDLGLIPGPGRSPEEGNGNPLQYSCLGNPLDRGTWWATVHIFSKSQTWLSDWTHTETHTCASSREWQECKKASGNPGCLLKASLGAAMLPLLTVYWSNRPQGQWLHQWHRATQFTSKWEGL